MFKTKIDIIHADCLFFFVTDMSRLEKSPLLANGYNQPPHMSHMPFMQLPHPAAAHSALLSPGMPHNLGRPDGSVIKNQGIPSMEAIARLVYHYLLFRNKMNS